MFSIDVARGAGPQVAHDPASTALAVQQPDDADATRVIALVEDDPGVRNALEFLLATSGYRVISAKDGPSALALLANELTPPDLIVTDYNLPGGMSGIDVLAAVRSRLGPDMPGIVLTGYIAKDTLAKIQRVNCVMLSKPAAAADLRSAIVMLLSSANPD